MTVRWRPFPLHPQTPVEGLPLSRLFAGSTVDIEAMGRQLEQVAQQLGLPYGKRTMTYNSRLAQELGLWAESQGKADCFHRAAFLAYFRDGINLALPTALIPLAEGCGLSAAEAQQVVRTRSLAETVDREWQTSRKLGITAVPTILFAGHRLTGFQPYDRVKQLLDLGSAIPNNLG